MPPQRPDLVGLLQQSYQQYCLQLLKAFDNEETQAIIRAHGGEDFKCGPLVFIGHVLVDDGTPRDCYLAPGFPMTSWSVPLGPVALYTRHGTTNVERWKVAGRARHASSALVSQPRYLLTKRDPNAAVGSLDRGVLATMRGAGFTVCTHVFGVAQIFWMQKVWSGDKLVSDTDRLGRGDPESPHVSYAKIAILGGPGSSVVGGYEAVVCSAIAQDPYSGRFHPWTAADPVLLPFGSYSPPWPLPGVHGLAVVPPRHPDRHLPHPWGPHTSYALSHRQRHNYGQTHARGGTRSVMD